MKQYIPTLGLAVKVLLVVVIDKKLRISDRIAGSLPG